jgi:sporulation integral membrane protein YtvI
MENPKIYLKIFVNFLFGIAVMLFIILAVPRLLGFFMPFFIGWIISLIANPLVRFLENKMNIVRKHGSAIIIIAVLLAVVGILYFAVSTLAREVINLVSDIPQLYGSVELQIQKVQNNMQGIYHFMPAGVKDIFDNLGESMNTYIRKWIAGMGTPTFHDATLFAKNIAELLLMSIITILSAYFFIADRDKLIQMIKKVTPPSVQKQYRIIADNFAKAVGGYFKAQFKIMIIIMFILFVGFQIIRVNYSFLLALLIAFLDFLPVFGTGTIIWPWALYELISGNYFRAVALMVLYLICQLLKQLLQPKMVGDSIGLNPLSTLVFMFIGYRIKGVLGMIIGIPVGMVLINLYHAGMFDRFIRGFKIIAHDLNEFRKF